MQRITSKLILAAICAMPLQCLAQKNDPCPDGPNVSNVDLRECYTKAQTDMTRRADDLAALVAANLRKTSPKEKAIYGPVILQDLENAAKKLEQSQLSWHSYRDQNCDALGFSYTTGSGARTATEECLYRTALARVRQLLLDFSDFTGHKRHSSSQAP